MSHAVAALSFPLVIYLLFAVLALAQRNTNSDTGPGATRVQTHCPFGGATVRFHITSQRDDVGKDVFKAHVDRTYTSTAPWNVTVNLDNKCAPSGEQFQRMTVTFVGTARAPPVLQRRPSMQPTSTAPTSSTMRLSPTKKGVIGGLTRRCLDCICLQRGCPVHNPFFITPDYWAASGKPGFFGYGNEVAAYHQCIDDFTCSEATVKSYLTEFSQDCNGDGVVNCFDYFAIHLVGRSHCTTLWRNLYLNMFSKEPACADFL